MKQVNSFNCRALRGGVAALLLLATSVAANAYDFSAKSSSYKGITIYYNILSEEDKTCEVTSKDIYNTSTYSGDVVVPQTVKYGETTYSVTSIGEYAFYGCGYKLTSVSIPNSVTEIGRCAFFQCARLTSFSIPNSVITIGVEAFGYCLGLTEVTIPESVTSIGDYAFYNCTGLTSVTIPDSVTEIGNRAFSDCKGLTEVTIGNSVTTIGSSAFQYCTGLTEVTIGNSVTSIGSSAFEGCTSLTQFVVAEGNEYYCAVDGVLYSKDITTLVRFPIASPLLPSFEIPNSVTSIGEYAFCDCTGLTSVTIPECVTVIDDYAFYKCTGLTSVTIPECVTVIDDYAFYGCTGLTEVTIGNSVTTIGKSAFSGCTGLTEVTIGESVTTIDTWAFCDCSGLTSIYSFNPEPPECRYNIYYNGVVFYNVNKSTCTLYVPEGSLEAYSTADQWQDFLNIVEFDVTPVSSITADGNAEAVGFYTLDGKQVSTPQRGINIIRYSDGTVRKVLVR